MAVLLQNRKSNSAKISYCEDYCQKFWVYYENVKQNILTEFSWVIVFSWPKELQIFFKPLNEL